MFFLTSFQPTYGTPVSDGLAQLRVFNGFNCNITLNVYNPAENITDKVIIDALGVYEKLDIEAHQQIELPYSLRGGNKSDCMDVNYDGKLVLKEKTANSFFVSNYGISQYDDNNDKAIDGVKVR